VKSYLRVTPVLGMSEGTVASAFVLVASPQGGVSALLPRGLREDSGFAEVSGFVSAFSSGSH
jgi:hypothetical protein